MKQFGVPASAGQTLEVLTRLDSRHAAPAEAGTPNLDPRSLSADDHLGALEIKLKPHFLQSLFPHAVAQLGFIFGVEHEEPPPARADQFSTEGPIGHLRAVP